MSSKKKKNISANSKKQQKKFSNKRRLIIGVVLGMAIVAAAVISTVIFSFGNGLKNELCAYEWTPVSAKNASGDEVDMSEVYNTNYSAYKGSLDFKDDGKFSLWLSPGTADDGTHTGSFELKSDGEINAYFDDGTNTVFKVRNKNGKVDGIIINYDNYEVYFTRG